jgi:colanic acid biosynthesis protein WcaH
MPPASDARFLGAFEHFYKNNRFGAPDYGTHYVVLGYEFKVNGTAGPKADDQHGELRWWPLDKLLASDTKIPRLVSPRQRPRAAVDSV